MDTISTSLTVAWLDAFRRVQSDSYRRLVAEMPQMVPSRAERTLTDVVESGIVSGGATRVAEAVASAETGRRVDIRA